jgi:imidazolonepropionase-like amidohydrolase
VVRAGLLFDGNDLIRETTDVEIRDGRIVAVHPASGEADIDLGARLLAPGLIDTHVHLDWYVTAKDRLHVKGDGDDERTAILNAAGNAWRMLQAGFTTIQSVGAPADRYVRDAINRGVIPGPRVLSSLGRITAADGEGSFWSTLKRLVGIESGDSSDAIRAAVRRLKAQGANLIKIFAALKTPSGKQLTMTPAQLTAACEEARKAGLRSVVHAVAAKDVKNAVRAGCSQIDHGLFADDEAFSMMAAAGVYFEPQCSLVFENYLNHWNRFEGLGVWDAEQRAGMERLLENRRERAAKWASIDPRKLIYGTDAVAGAHGQNAADLVCRTRDVGQPAVDALRSATSVSAESLGLGDRIGRVAPGYEADLVAFDGDPVGNPERFMQAAFVVKGGVVYRLPPNRAGSSRLFPAPLPREQ